MLDIPFYSQFLWAWLFLPIGVFALVFAVRDILRGIHSLRESGLNTLETTPDKSDDERSTLGMTVQTLAGLVFTVAGLSMLIWGNAAIYRFRNIDVAQVIGLRVYRLPQDSSDSPYPAVEFRNRAVVQEGLEKLKGCSSQFRNHEHFYDGYRLELIFEDLSVDTHSISVLVRSSSSPSKTVVIPQLKDSGWNLGDYLCPSFQKWAAENLDPLFPEIPKRTP